jgi:anaerobic magnesium-protoporphyrin IX monomethyl ester cyclase
VDILLINLSLRPLSPVKMFPIGLGYIATALRDAGYTFDLLDIDGHRLSDEHVAHAIGAKHYDVVCMGCIVTGYRYVKELCSVIREAHPHATIVVGNSVASSIADTLLTRTEADIAVMGEGDETVVDLMETIERDGDLESVPGICFVRGGELVSTPRRPPIADISSLPFIDYTLFDVDIYIDSSRQHLADRFPVPREDLRSLPVNTARGCVARCTFCYHVFDGLPYRHRSADAVLAEIRQMMTDFSLNVIAFHDELTFHSKRQALEFAEKVLAADMHFYWEADCRSNLFDRDEDIEIILKMKEAGCTTVGYSLESSDPGILKAMNKRSTVEQFSFQTQLFHKAGMPPVTSLVLGFPQETPETIQATFDCCIENRIYPSAGYLLPQPGSAMYAYAVEHGFVTDEEDYLLSLGDRQDLRLNLTEMSDEEFEQNVRDGLRRCNEALNVGLSEDQLIKTQFYRAVGGRSDPHGDPTCE